jgi:DNA polymerase elongation subunit (family B)
MEFEDVNTTRSAMNMNKGSGIQSDKTNYVVIDVEVYPVKYEESEINEYLMDKNFPRKIHPLFSRVLVIGFKAQNGETELLYYKDEKELLTKFWSRIQELKPDLFVTFNGYNFDIPFLHVRSKVNGVTPLNEINLNKWRSETSNHYDCMQVLSSNQTFLNVALDISCRIFNIPIPEQRFYGEDVYKLYEAGKLEAIKEHCGQDIELTEQLYLKLTE